MLVRRSLFHLEAPEDGGGGEAAVADAPVVESAPAESAAAESFAISPEEWEAMQTGWQQTQAGMSQLAAYLQSQGQQQPYEEPAQEFSLDPLDDNYGEQLASFLQARDEALMGQFQQMLQPLVQANQQARIHDGMEQLRDIFYDDAQQHGEFAEGETAFEMALALGRTLYGEAAQRFGDGDRAAEAAFGQAIQTLRERDKAIGEAAVERYKNEIATLAGAPREPGASGVGTQVIGGQRPDSLVDIARRYGSAG